MIYKELLKPEIISAPETKTLVPVTFHEQKYFISPKK